MPDSKESVETVHAPSTVAPMSKAVEWKRPENPVHAHFDCFSGAAGDMMMAACLDAAAGMRMEDTIDESGKDKDDPKERSLATQALLRYVTTCLKKGLPELADEFEIKTQRVWRGHGSIAGLHVQVKSRYHHKAAPVPEPAVIEPNTHQQADNAKQPQEHSHTHEHAREHCSGEVIVSKDAKNGSDDKILPNENSPHNKPILEKTQKVTAAPSSPRSIKRHVVRKVVPSSPLTSKPVISGQQESGEGHTHSHAHAHAHTHSHAHKHQSSTSKMTEKIDPPAAAEIDLVKIAEGTESAPADKDEQTLPLHPPLTHASSLDENHHHSGHLHYQDHDPAAQERPNAAGGEIQEEKSASSSGPASDASVAGNFQDHLHSHEHVSSHHQNILLHDSHDHTHEHQHSHEHHHQHLDQYDEEHLATLTPVSNVGKAESKDSGIAIHSHIHSHDHDHGHGHHHHSHSHAHTSDTDIGPLRNLPEIRNMLLAAPVEYIPEWVRATAIQVFTVLAKAEATVHGASSSDAVHFHEVGAVDSIVDVVGTLLALYNLGVTTVSCSRLPLGEGMVRTQHGILPVPAPATLQLMTGMPTTRGPPGVTGELVTPTGAALLRTLTSQSKAVSLAGQPPNFTLHHVGVGAGTKNFERHPNILRVMLGELAARDNSAPFSARAESKV